MPHYGKTQITVCGDNEDLGRQAAAAVAAKLHQLLAEKDTLRVIFAAGESQSTFHRALAREEGIPWQRIVCFNVDDFWDPRLPREFTCGYQTERELYSQVNPSEYHLVDFKAPEPEAEARRFGNLVMQAPIDLLCQGIGTSGHLALNEPGDTALADPRPARVVSLVEQSKRQLREDPNFRDLGYVPDQGITLTIPAILAARSIFTMVPLALKKPILTRLLETLSPTPALPASVLVEVESRLFVDRDSCPDSLR
ncbi:MAG: 6-phosphogluconolactonase [Candidatus Handelsmanbacteria bacterium]|nr:6-phosphogluconolactonase [Candidatus Handelsmanbacteria bacterium]